MIIDFRIIPHRQQRYPTVGDWFAVARVQHFRVSKMTDPRYCWLVFLHEIIEWTICRLKKIRIRDIDRFDVAYEKARKSGRAPCGCRIDDEPGNDVHAPYREAHQVATQCERLIAKVLGVEWGDYDRAVEAL